MMLSTLFTVVLSVGFAVGQDYEQDDAFRQRAIELLAQNPLIDGHNDFSYNLMSNFQGQLSLFDLNQDMCVQYPKSTNCHTDIPKLTQGMAGAQFFSAFTGCNTQYKDGVERALELVDLIKRFTQHYSDFFQMAYSTSDILSAFAAGRFASLIGLEGGHMISDNMAILRIMYDVGVRYMTLTWNCNTAWADCNKPDADLITPPKDGLSDWGRLLIAEMNRLGMLVDLSHVSPATMRDVLEVTQAPVMFSHSSVYSLCPHTRNVPDDVMLAVKNNSGVIMINFYSKFLNCTAENVDEGGFRGSNVDIVIDHMDYIKNLIGADYIGIGSDYDGIELVPTGLEDSSKFPNLIAHMLRRGWTEEDVLKVMGQNFIRVFQQVEQVRDSLAAVIPQDLPIPTAEIPDLTCENPW